MKDLVDALNKATATVSLIRDEIEEGRQMLADLESRASVQQQLTELQDEQVHAVADQLRVELRAESRRGLVRDISLRTLFFLMGVAVTYLVG